MREMAADLSPTSIDLVNLCEICSLLNPERIVAGNARPRSYAGLVSSAPHCDMCRMLLDGIHESYFGPDNLQSELRHNAAILRAYSVQREAFLSNTPIIPLRHFVYCVLPKITENELGMYRLPDPASFSMPAAAFTIKNCQGRTLEVLGGVTDTTSLLGSSNSSIRLTELMDQPDWVRAREWIEDCLSSHPSCGREHDFPSKGLRMPTRLIYIGDGRNDLRLIEAGSDTHPYVTLSHCWGNVKRPFVTNHQKNVKQHLQSIPFGDMPLTFRDAVAATRSLGYKYLWINSLCIIQNDALEWENECAKMCDIYEGSVVTICGPEASDSTQGFLHSRTSKPGTRRWKYEKKENGKGDGDSEWKKAVISSLGQPKPRPPLSTRGWALQEYLLALRTISFTADGMLWDCRTICLSEDKECDITYHSLQFFRKSHILDVRTSESRLEYVWRFIVTEYSRRSLSRQSDRLPALSGIATRLFGDNHEEYLAGLPRRHFRTWLTWVSGFVPQSPPQQTDSTRDEQQRHRVPYGAGPH